MIEACVLKGKTTSEAQFEEFMSSYIEAIEYREENHPSHDIVHTTFLVDTDEAEKCIHDYEDTWRFGEEGLTILRRDDDPGELRNSFMNWLATKYTDDMARRDNLVFMFFDGDDKIQERYFMFDETLVKGKGFGIMNPVAFYGSDPSDYYTLKWCLTAAHGDIFRHALMDSVGGQCWGKVWDFPIAKECKFGRGLFEDTPFWCQATEKYRNPVLYWNQVYFWRRNNPNALTRNNPSIESIRRGLDNLDECVNIALQHYKVTDIEVWRRYSIGVLILLKNAAKVQEKDQEKLIQYISDRLNRECFHPDDIKQLEPKFWKTVTEAYPEIEEMWDI